MGGRGKGKGIEGSGGRGGGKQRPEPCPLFLTRKKTPMTTVTITVTTNKINNQKQCTLYYDSFTIPDRFVFTTGSVCNNPTIDTGYVGLASSGCKESAPCCEPSDGPQCKGTGANPDVCPSDPKAIPPPGGGTGLGSDTVAVCVFFYLDPFLFLLARDHNFLFTTFFFSLSFSLSLSLDLSSLDKRQHARRHGVRHRLWRLRRDAERFQPDLLQCRGPRQERPMSLEKPTAASQLLLRCN